MNAVESSRTREGARRLCLSVLACACLLLPAGGAEPEPLVVDGAEVAGICGFRALWDVPVPLAEDGATEEKHGAPTAAWAPAKRDGGRLPGAIAFDALHRATLVRFPGAAERIAAKLREGHAIEKVELVLPFRATELAPPGDPNFAPEDGGYHYRFNWGVDKLWKKIPPRWHAAAWALRRPWKADPRLGPTFNAYVNGAGYWTKYGASDEEQDRFPRRFGPTEVSHESPEGVMDVTAALVDPAFGATPGERLRRLADCGFIVKKWELYDHRYYTGAYEWATGTGGRGILVKAPKLVVSFRRDRRGKRIGRLPPPVSVEALAETLRASGSGGEPTAVMPTPRELAELAERFAPKRPDWMPEWQWRRVEELRLLGGGRDKLTAEMPFWYRYVPGYIRDRMKRQGVTPERVYARWVDSMLGKQPRGWYGFEGPRVLVPWFLYRDAMPAPVRDYWRLWWTAWLMPDRPTAPRKAMCDFRDASGDLIHPMADDSRVGGKGAPGPAPLEGTFDTYYATTGDWRGNKSFFRAGFCHTMSTMNFNHSSSLGALLGGAIIGSERAMKDGRHGLEHWPLRTWSWLDGTTQESIDHYYFAITLSAQKLFADFGPTRLDRMMGRMILAKSMDELASAYHPGLRRFIAGSARTSMDHVLASQDGVYHIVHTLSRRGVLHGLGDTDLPGGIPVVGREVPPLRIARQSLTGPWAPEWMAEVVDGKELPFEMTSAFTKWGGWRRDPMWRRTYLGRHYGLYSSDMGWGYIPLMAQWKRKDAPVEHMHERGTMLVRYGYNETRLVNMGGGWIAPFGALASLQHRGKLVLVASPHDNHFLKGRQDEIRSLQCTAAFYNHETPRPGWRVFAGDRPVTTLPAELRAGDRITIHDGVSYIGVIPLPATDLGRDLALAAAGKAAVVLSEGGEQEYDGKKYRAALVIDNQNLRREEPLGKGADWKTIDRAYGGFVIEFADATEYPGFEDFRRHVAGAELSARWEGDAGTFHVRYASGGDVLELGVKTAYANERPSDELFAYRRVNGEWPYPAKGNFRETPVTVQGTTGRLEKGGAVLVTEPGKMSCLTAEPRSGTYVALNPFPDLVPFTLQAPGGVEVAADGRLGIASVTVRPSEAKLWVSHALREADRGSAGVAESLLVSGLAREPAVELNGEPLDRVERRGETYVIPLR